MQSTRDMCFCGLLVFRSIGLLWPSFPACDRGTYLLDLRPELQPERVSMVRHDPHSRVEPLTHFGSPRGKPQILSLERSQSTCLNPLPLISSTCCRISFNTGLFCVQVLIEKYAVSKVDQTATGIACYQNLLSIPVLLVGVMFAGMCFTRCCSPSSAISGESNAILELQQLSSRMWLLVALSGMFG